jgi:hypothetical protein
MDNTTPGKLYEGTKRVRAWPMDRLTYNRYRGWTLPGDENGDDAGYLVEYTDGGKSNHHNHTGYISWSPADVFARAYHEIPEPGLQSEPAPDDWKHRLVQERAELGERIEKLAAFVGTHTFSNLEYADRDLLGRQLAYMRQYEYILDLRGKRAFGQQDPE